MKFDKSIALEHVFEWNVFMKKGIFCKEITPYLTLSKKNLLNRFLVCSCYLLGKKRQKKTLEYLEDLNM